MFMCSCIRRTHSYEEVLQSLTVVVKQWQSWLGSNLLRHREWTPPTPRPSVFDAMRRGPLFSSAGPLERSASWALPEPSLFQPGGGPTIAHTIEVSKRPEDLRLVSAAAAGDLSAVETALHHAALEAHVRLPGFLRATTALHAASSAGAVDVVRHLLEARAAVAGRHGQLRALTPLHDAATEEVALVLLAARGNPWANDPREPDPAWYHEQRNRHAVATLIRQRRSDASPVAGDSSPSMAALPRLPSLPLSSAELQAIRRSFSVKGSTILQLLRRSPDEDAESAECSICMIEITADDDILSLPCGGSHGKSSTCRPHAFHQLCLERWLLTKAGACPICRHSLRGKRKTQSAPARHREIQELPTLQPLQLQPLQPSVIAPQLSRVPVAKPRTRSAYSRHPSGLPLPEIDGRSLLR